MSRDIEHGLILRAAAQCTCLAPFFRAIAFPRHRALATILVVAALCMKALVPAGYMIGQVDRVLTVEICADSQGGHLTKQIVIPGDGQSHGGQSEHGKSDGTCAFSALSFASLSAADPALLARTIRSGGRPAIRSSGLRWTDRCEAKAKMQYRT